jgi:hypothetical protein
MIKFSYLVIFILITIYSSLPVFQTLDSVQDMKHYLIVNVSPYR